MALWVKKEDVCKVCLLLLASFRQILVILVTIPLVYTSTIALMWLTGINFNVITLTAIILVTEMVGGMNQLMPLAICSFSAFVTADLLGVDPIYESLLERLIASHDSKRNGKKYLFELPVQAESHFSGKEIRAVSWPEDVLVTSIRRGQQNVVATGKTVMQTGDVLHILTDMGLAKTVQEELKQLEKRQKRQLFDT